MKPLIVAALFVLGVTCCALRYAKWPIRVEHSGPDELDPIRASLEDHIFALSSLKGAVPTSPEYRERLSEGFRHPKTLAHKGEEFVHVTEKPSALLNPDAHAYLLDRSGRRFTTFCYGSEAAFRRLECFRDDSGWWLQDPSPQLFSSAK